MQSLPNNGDKPKKSSAKQFTKYAGLGISMFVVMFVFYYLGNLLDKYWELEKPYIGLLCLLLATGAYFYKLIKELS